MRRRSVLKAIGAAVLASASRPSAASRSTPEWTPELVKTYRALGRAFDHHIKYGVCFRTKMAAGHCTYGGDVLETDEHRAFHLAQNAALRLAYLDIPSAALIYFAQPDNILDIFVLPYSPDNVVTHAQVQCDIAALIEGMRIGLDVNARAATRSAVPFGKITQESVAPVGLETVAEVLLPDNIRSALKGYGRILVLPSGPIGQVPFAALPFGTDRMVVDHASIVIVPSLDVLIPKDISAKHLFEAQAVYDFQPEIALDGLKLVIGDLEHHKRKGWDFPALPATKKEVRAVATAFGISTVLTGKLATRKAIMSKLKRMTTKGGVVHFATHGVSDSVNPMDASFLAVSDGAIYAREVSKLKFSPNSMMVVMSACQSGLGKTFPGGGFGLARAWYSVGAGQVVASLWNVDDEGTYALMELFSKYMAFNMQGHGFTSESCLQVAMQDVRDNYSSDPAIWASFVIFGHPSNVFTSSLDELERMLEHWQ